VKEWAAGEVAKYRQAFCLYNAARAKDDDSYQFQIADLRDGELKVVPEALRSIDSIDGAICRHLGKYYKKMGEGAPWEEKAMDEELDIREGDETSEAPVTDESLEVRESDGEIENEETPDGPSVATEGDPAGELSEGAGDDDRSAELSPSESDTEEPPGAEERTDTLDEPRDTTDEPPADEAEPLVSRARVRNTLSTF
jgi:hypothetical protein